MNYKKIIKAAVKKAVSSAINADETVTREEIARRAALLADRKGVNVMSEPFLQDIYRTCLEEMVD